MGSSGNMPSRQIAGHFASIFVANVLFLFDDRLLLTMKLIYRGYYQEDGNKTVPLTESEFVDEIFNYHTTIFLSSQFLAEIYQSTLAENCFTFLMPSGELTEKLEAIPLIKLLHG